jgi:hypothetical protein
VRLKRPIFPRQARAEAFLVNLRRQHRCPFGTRAEAKPNHADGATAPERPDIVQREFESSQRSGAQRIGDRLDDRAIDAADKAKGEVQIFGRRPAKVGRQLSTRCDESSELITLRLRDRKPEESADPQRVRFFFQFSWAHVLGRVGRQP